MIALAVFAAATFAQAAGASAPTPAPAPALTSAPVLDKEKGARAIDAYRKFRRQLCAEVRTNQGRGERLSARLKAVGLGEDVDQPEGHLCGAGMAVKAVASGAFLESAKDEVLLEVSTLRSAQTGQSLAVMRDDGTGYRLIKHLFDAAIFEARLRLSAPGRRDILVLCEYRGLGGVYPGDCGFLGRGSFREPIEPRKPDREPNDGVELIELREFACGPFERVSAGKVTAQGERLVGELVLEKGDYVPTRADVEGSCSKRTSKTRRSFDIEYKFDGQKFRRVTPTPKAVQELLNQG